MRTTESVITEIINERISQKEKWSKEHDKEHTDWEWIQLIESRLRNDKITAAAALCVAWLEIKDSENIS